MGIRRIFATVQSIIGDKQMKQTFTVSGMKCTHCKANVENAIKGVDGVVAAEADLNEANVTVDFEAPATPEAIQAAVNGAGRYELSL